jgi:anion-transporting  ArsA/GET3 family ATPase
MSTAPFQVIVGKGGVGKSTIAAALARAEAAAGNRTLVAELGRPAGLARALGVDAGRAGEIRAAAPGLSFTWVDGEAALAEYLALVVPVRRVLSAVLDSKLYRYFVAAAPGLRELMTIGKLWYEYEKLEADGSRTWDRIIVDAGASGHALQYLKMPATAARTFRSGLVHRESEKIAAHLRNADVTRTHVVALPEAMPLVEAAEIVEQLTDELGIAVGEVFVNRCRNASPDGVGSALDRLAAMRTQLGEHGALIVDTAQRALAWEKLQNDGISAFEARTGRGVVCLPLLVSEEFGPVEIDSLAARLGTELSVAKACSR